MKRTMIGTTGALLAVLVAGAANAAPLPAQKCRASKNQAAGKYAACRQNAEKGLATTGDTAKYDAAISKCETKFAAAWQKAIDTAAAATATCPDTPLAQADYKTVIDEHCDNIATALGGGGLSDCAGDLTTCQGDLNTCSGNLSSCSTDYTTCAGSLATCNAGTATAGDVLSGKTFSSSAGLGITGSVPAGANLNGANGSKTFTIPDGLYSGSKTATANDTNLASTNIKSGVTILGVTGILLPPTCGNGAIDGTEQCDLGTLNSQTCETQGFAGGTLRCGAWCVFDTSGCYATRYVDNSNGTITDEQTGLMWEKKVKLDGAQDFANLQDADNYYKWAGTCTIATSKYCQPTAAAAAACAAGVEGNATGCAECTGGDGTCNASTTVWTWLVALNTANFGTHSDWRLPKTTELEGLVDYADTSSPAINLAFHGTSCGTACTNVASAACSCTYSFYYWSASTHAPSPTNAWYVSFDYGYVNYYGKSSNNWARAVRRGL